MFAQAKGGPVVAQSIVLVWPKQGEKEEKLPNEIHLRIYLVAELLLMKQGETKGEDTNFRELP